MYHHQSQLITDDSYKCVVVGNSNSGKTLYTQICAVASYDRKNLMSSDSFLDEAYYIPTVGFNVETYQVNDASQKVFGVWDISGNVDRKSDEFSGYLAGADCAMIFDDGSVRHTKGDLWSVRKWRSLLHKQLGRNVPIVVVASKADDAVPGDVSQDGEIFVSSANLVNVDLPFRILSGMVDEFYYY